MASNSKLALNSSKQPFGIAIHGGAGALGVKELGPELQDEYLAYLDRALHAGHALLQAGGSSEAAVVAAVVTLEDAPLFNAGRGSVLTAEGKVEMDAALMRGDDKSVGSVMATTLVKNPIRLAQTIMHYSPHAILCGKGADIFAEKMGLDLEPLSYFVTEKRQAQLSEAQALEHALLDNHSGRDPQVLGTVGAVALDLEGNLAAATSTGGLTNKAPGRIGDTPIIGAGTFADNQTCAISATGRGELFIKHTIAAEIHYRMLFTGQSLHQAVQQAIHHTLSRYSGGIIAIDRLGQIVLDFNTPMMFRGFADHHGHWATSII